jgi:hypothetical protein
MRGFFPREQLFQAVRTSYQRLRSMKISMHYEARGKIPARILTPTSTVRVLENHVLRGTRIDRKISARDQKSIFLTGDEPLPDAHHH